MSGNKFIIARIVDAPRNVVWNAWTKNDELKAWFGPKGFPIAKCSLDLKPGGIFHYGMKTPDGAIMWGRWVFKEITPPSRLVFNVNFTDETGKVMTRHPFHSTWPMNTLSTVTFVERGPQTEIMVQWEPAPGSSDEERKTFAENHASMEQGWGGTFEQLSDYLMKKAA